MGAILLDTDVFSFLFKRDTRAKAYEPHLSNAHLCLSFQTVAEVRFWSLVRHWSEARRQSLNQALARYVVLPSDEAMTRIWAEISDHRRRIGHPIECGDAWIAASAIRHDATLLTHNKSHFAQIPKLTVISFA